MLSINHLISHAVENFPVMQDLEVDNHLQLGDPKSESGGQESNSIHFSVTAFCL